MTKKFRSPVSEKHQRRFEKAIRTLLKHRRMDGGQARQLGKELVKAARRSEEAARRVLKRIEANAAKAEAMALAEDKQPSRLERAIADGALVLKNSRWVQVVDFDEDWDWESAIKEDNAEDIILEVVVANAEFCDVWVRIPVMEESEALFFEALLGMHRSNDGFIWRSDKWGRRFAVPHATWNMIEEVVGEPASEVAGIAKHGVIVRKRQSAEDTYTSEDAAHAPVFM